MLRLLNVSGLERKISMRTSKEELIQRGILMPGDTASVTGMASPLVSSVITETTSRSSTPRLNLPHLASNNKSGRSFILTALKVETKDKYNYQFSFISNGLIQMMHRSLV